MSFRQLAKALIWTVLVLGVVGAALRVFVLQVWTIPLDDPYLTASIAPELRAGDVVLLLHAGTPGFSDLVRCTDPDEPARFVIGRVVGMPGDTVQIEQGRLTINGRSMPVDRACPNATFSSTDPRTGAAVELRCDQEELGGSTHMRASAVSGGMQSQAVKATVEPGYFYLVSDNRAYPLDSRSFKSQVDARSCDTRIFFRLWGQEGFGDPASRMTWIP